MSTARPLLVLALERDGLLSVLVPRDVDAPGAAAHGAVLLEDLLFGPAGVDVDVRGLAAVGAAELGLRVRVEVELLHHRAVKHSRVRCGVAGGSNWKRQVAVAADRARMATSDPLGTCRSASLGFPRDVPTLPR